MLDTMQEGTIFCLHSQADENRCQGSHFIEEKLIAFCKISTMYA